MHIVDDDLDVLDRIDRNICRCDNVIEDLLHFGRASSPVIEPVDLDEWVAATIADLDLDDRIGITANLRSGKIVDLDAERLRLCLISANANAHEAMADTGALIHPTEIATR